MWNKYEMKRCLLATAVIMITAGSFAQTIQPVYSSAWGRNGEKWDTAKIPDFTHAGYREGKPLPAYTASVDITKFGGKGDGKADNTTAFRKAIAACKKNGVVFVPAGAYLLSDSIIIRKGNISIRGAGKGTTILLFSKGLEELYPLYNIGTPNQTTWSWSGAMLLFDNTTGSGIEHLTVQFPDSAYAGHNFHERAYNAIGFTNGTNNGWVNDVQMINADIGIWVERSAHHITAQQWSLDFGPVRNAQKISGHHGVNIYGGYNLLQDFRVNGRYVHDLSVESDKSVFNVFRAGGGKDLCIDHHNHDQAHNLFTNLNAGEGTRLYFSGGKLVPQGVSFYETYWNITAKNDMDYCDHFNSAAMQSKNNTAVGIKTKEVSDTSNVYRNWFETIDPALLEPKDLYKAQLMIKNKKSR